MAVATPESVRGDFGDVTIESQGSKGRFFRDRGGFFVETDGGVARYRNGDAQGALEEVRRTLEPEPEHPGLLEWFAQLGMLTNVA